MPENVRIDKWLWAVRIFKTRSQASEACRKGHVSIGDLPVKPSREIHPGEIVKVRKAPDLQEVLKFWQFQENECRQSWCPIFSKMLHHPKNLNF